MLLNADEVRTLYRRTARLYDGAVWMYRLLGIDRHRALAVEALGLRPGDSVVDLGCGTGLNLPLLHAAVGEEGRIIAVDLTDAMLQRARRRAGRAGLHNVEFVEADLTGYCFPPDLTAALATFVLEMIPEYDGVVRAVAAALPPGGRLAVLGLKHPERWPRWLVEVGIWLNRPFGVSRDYAALRPWQSLRQHMREVEHRVLLLGAAYLSVGEAS